ncbi:hypothetical protein N7449_002033 [Penicillium cf. viridicatum]|uniref:Uncharacterized protein n=1 Tax=Penicillium cf. viridicatum TaxID=2972119 RepID=A0A9W9MUL7_9EURO|nr:hypothetical protein N7449_002033 [Penicillium cf. viridicatum]
MTSDRRIAEMVELPTQKEEVQLLDPTSLECLVDFGYGLGWNLRQDILAIRTVILQDGCVIGLKLQHPFGDANAMMRIAKAYCALVDGKLVDPVSFIRPPLEVKSGYKSGAEGNAVGWASLLKSSWRQRTQIFKNSSSRRIPKSLFIPRKQIHEWTKEAQEHTARVIENDLILSYLYRHFSNDEARSPNLGITMNVQRQLQREAGFSCLYHLILTKPKP